MLSVVSILDNCNNKPNPLDLLKIDNLTLANPFKFIIDLKYSISEVNKATVYFIEFVNKLKYYVLSDISFLSKPWATMAVINSKTKGSPPFTS